MLALFEGNTVSWNALNFVATKPNVMEVASDFLENCLHVRWKGGDTVVVQIKVKCLINIGKVVK